MLLGKDEQLTMEGVRVLIVEDSRLMAEAIETTLVDAGAVVTSITASVSAALSALGQETIDLACLDIDLGKEDSFPVADELALRSIPYIFVTGGKVESIPAHHRDQSCIRKMDIAEALVPACWRASHPGVAEHP